MQGLQKSKRISWASDGNLCQVRLFLSEEPPSQVGLGGQDHLEAKKSLSGSPVNGLVAEDNLPPGFEGFSPANQLKNRLAQIPVIKWRAPPKFILDVEWQVVSGQESKEIEIQDQRELRVLEAYYPRQSAIPPNPAVASDIECAVQDDKPPIVPITPIEEEDLSEDPSDFAASASATTSTNPLVLQGEVSLSQGVTTNFSNGTSPAVLPSLSQEDALKAALTSVAKSHELIDHELLLKIFNNPTILEQLVRHQDPGPLSQSILPMPMERPQPIAKPQSFPPVAQLNMEKGSSSSAMMSNGYLYPYANGTVPMTHQPLVSPVPGVVPQVSSVSAPASHVKDINYYKNLIQQHGEERQVEPQLPPPFPPHPIHHHQGIDQDVVDNSKPRDAKPKIMKPCIYFNTPKGCRNGAKCIYQHDMSGQKRVSNISEMQSAKRMKEDKEFRGSQS
ncbi:unnamed protein product [Amaranthus hypochondriacus]